MAASVSQVKSTLLTLTAPALIGVFFPYVHDQTLIDKHNTGPFNAISRKIVPFRAGVTRANKINSR